MARKKKTKWHPEYWLGLTVLHCLRPLAWLPYSVQMKLGRWLGRRIGRRSGKTQHVARTNINLCFPHLNEQQKNALYARNFESFGMAFFETILAQWASPKKLLRLLHSVTGLDAVKQTLQNKEGVILLFSHLMPMYLVGHLLLLKSQLPVSLMYHSPRNLALKKFMDDGLRKHCKKVFTRRDIRELIQHLRDGHLVWYAADIDLGKHHSVFAPFFGIEASTLTAPARLAKLTRAKIFPIGFYRRDDGRGYDIHIEPAMTHFPSHDEVDDMTRINQTIEQMVKKHPEQYLWQYRRFQTRPKGEAKIY